jgi:hypothetical protein
MFEKINIEEKNNELHVTVTLKSTVKAKRKIKAHTRHIIDYLNENKTKFGKCIKEIILHNESEHARVGTWIFSIPPSKKKSVQKRTTNHPIKTNKA